MAIKAKTDGKAKASAKRSTKASTMTKAQLIGHLSEKFELMRNVAAAIIDELATLAINETKKNGAFILHGLGKLVKVQRKARMGMNPQTKEKIKIPAKTVVKFRVAKVAKEAIAPPGKK